MVADLLPWWLCAAVCAVGWRITHVRYSDLLKQHVELLTFIRSMNESGSE